MSTSIYLLSWTVPLQGPLPEYLEDLTPEHLRGGAAETLAQLAELGQLYVVAGSTAITENCLQKAYEQLGLARYISGYFCAANVQLQKGTPAFILRTLMMLNATPGQVTVVGEEYQEDILPALLLGLKAVWLNPTEGPCPSGKVTKLDNLSELVASEPSQAVAQ